MGKRQRTAAVQDAVALPRPPLDSARLWSAAAPCRFRSGAFCKAWITCIARPAKTDPGVVHRNQNSLPKPPDVAGKYASWAFPATESLRDRLTQLGQRQPGFLLSHLKQLLRARRLRY